MSSNSNEAVSVLRYVLAFLAVKCLGMVGLIVYQQASGNEPPDVSNPLSIIAILLAVTWFCHRVKRPMTRSEIVRLAFGNVLVEVGLGLAFFLLVFILAGSLVGVFGANISAQEATAAIIAGLVISSVVTFALSAFFAWFFPKQYLKNRDTEKPFADP